MISFNPEPTDKLKRRVSEALLKIWNAEYIRSHPDADRPGLHRKYIFDFETGTRLIMSREKYLEDPVPRIHVSLSLVDDSIDFLKLVESDFNSDFLEEMVTEKLREINLQGKLSYIGVSKGHIIHWFVDRLQ